MSRKYLLHTANNDIKLITTILEDEGLEKFTGKPSEPLPITFFKKHKW